MVLHGVSDRLGTSFECLSAVVSDASLPKLLRGSALDLICTTFLDVPPQLPVQLVRYTRVWSDTAATTKMSGEDATLAADSTHQTPDTVDLPLLRQLLVSILDELVSATAGLARGQSESTPSASASESDSVADSICQSHAMIPMHHLLDSVLQCFEFLIVFGLVSIEKCRDELNKVTCPASLDLINFYV